MKNLKLILKSLVSNNACLDGGRKKPWYFAAIMFFLSIVFALLPLFVSAINSNGDDAFKTYNYGADQATLRFNEYLNDNAITMSVKTSPSGEKFFASVGADQQTREFTYEHKIQSKTSENTYVEAVDYKFIFRTNFDEAEANAIITNEKVSFFYFSEKLLYVSIVNFDTKAQIGKLACVNAAKYVEDGMTINSLLSTNPDATARITETFTNWKGFIRKSYNFTRLTNVWQTCAIMGGIDAGIVLFMGLMIWILTRGKNNFYRSIGIWQCQKTAWWTTISPAILTLAFGFLIKSFANILFPMLIGIRIMWLTMRSLRPDGSGYQMEDF